MFSKALLICKSNTVIKTKTEVFWESQATDFPIILRDEQTTTIIGIWSPRVIILENILLLAAADFSFTGWSIANIENPIARAPQQPSSI